MFDSHAGEEAERFRAKHGSISLWFGPDLFFVVAKNDDAKFGPEGQDVLILLDGENTHGGDGPWAAFFTHCPILAEGDALEGIHVFN